MGRQINFRIWHFHAEGIENRAARGTKVVRQGEVADRFFVMMEGTASVWVEEEDEDEDEDGGEKKGGAAEGAAGGEDEDDDSGCEMKNMDNVTSLDAIACFGESALLVGAGDGVESERRRLATVRVESEMAGLLVLDRAKFINVLSTVGAVKDATMEKIGAMAAARATMNAERRANRRELSVLERRQSRGRLRGLAGEDAPSFLSSNRAIKNTTGRSLFDE
jgi:CRP-like cAMP-binding protein